MPSNLDERQHRTGRLTPGTDETPCEGNPPCYNGAGNDASTGDC
jgi:hypothetical protein